MAALTSDEFLNDPYPFYSQLRAAGAIWNEENAFWLIGRHADITRLLRSPKISADRHGWMMSRVPASLHPKLPTLSRILKNRMLLNDPPRHDRLRSIMNYAFAPRSVAAATRTIEEYARDTAAQLRNADGATDLVDAIAQPLPTKIVTWFLGLPEQDSTQIRDWAQKIYDFIGLHEGEIEARALAAEQAAGEFSDYLDSVAGSDLRPDSVLHTLTCKRIPEGKLNRDEFVANIIALLNASQETTSGLISLSLNTLLKRRDLLAHLVSDPASASNLITELARFHTPVQMISRQCKATLEVAGAKIKPNQTITMILAAANRDASAFTRPDEILIGRSSSERHLAFGWGSHYCIGGALGRAVAESAIRYAAPILLERNYIVESKAIRKNPVFRGFTKLVVSPRGVRTKEVAHEAG